MSTDSKPSRGRKLLTIALIGIPLYILIQMTYGTIMGIIGINHFSRAKLTGEVYSAQMISNRVIFERRMKPQELLSSICHTSTPAAVGNIVIDYPEIIEVIKIDEKGKYNTIYTDAPNAQVHDVFMALVPKILDTLKTSYNNAYWDTTLKRADVLIQSPDNDYLLSYLKRGKAVTVIVLDPLKLAEVLPEVFVYAMRTTPLVSRYFIDFATYPVKISIKDRGGREFFTYGKPGKNPWKETSESETKPLPWKMTTQLYAENEMMIASANAAGKFPWMIIVGAFIAAGCVVILAVRKR